MYAAFHSAFIHGKVYLYTCVSLFILYSSTSYWSYQSSAIYLILAHLHGTVTKVTRYMYFSDKIMPEFLELLDEKTMALPCPGPVSYCRAIQELQ